MQAIVKVIAIIIAAIVAYVLTCSLQVFLIGEGVGLSIPFGTVVMSTVKIMWHKGPWVPFLMTPNVKE